MGENLKAESCFRKVVTDIQRRLPLAANQLNSENMVNAEVPEKVDVLCGNIPIMEVDGHYSMDFLGFRELHETAEQRSTDILSLASFGSPLVTSSASDESGMFLQVEKLTQPRQVWSLAPPQDLFRRTFF